MKSKTLSLIFLLVPAAALADHKTIPAQLTEAKTASIVCNGRPCSKSIQSAAIEALLKWGRYIVVDSDKDADLIVSFELSAVQNGPDEYRPVWGSGAAGAMTGGMTKVQQVTKRWTLSILDSHQAAHPKLLDITHNYSGSDDDAFATYDLIRRLMKDIRKKH
jgi:hypothetical protein